MNADVVVIGGGPAGCAAAIALRKKGYSVVVINASNQRGKPTETATPLLKNLLHSIDAEAALSACEPCFGISSNWGRAAPEFVSSIMNPFGHAWFVYRSCFDNYLRQIARDLNVTWIEARAHSIEFDKNGILARADTIVRARWLVIATGSPSWCARVTNQTPLNFDSLIAFWTHLPIRAEERSLFVESSEHGWWYLCPGDDQATLVCFVTDAKFARTHRVSQLNVWNEMFSVTGLSRRCGEKVTATFLKGAPTGISALPKVAGPRWVAVGDAALKLDPLGSSGIMTALDSGRRAALAIDGSSDDNHAAIKAYEGWFSGLLNEFKKQRHQHYALEAKQRTTAFWANRLSSAFIR